MTSHMTIPAWNETQKQRVAAWNELQNVIRRIVTRVVASTQPKLFLCHAASEDTSSMVNGGNAEQAWVAQFQADLTAAGFWILSGHEIAKQLGGQAGSLSKTQLEKAFMTVLSNVDGIVFVGTPAFKSRVEDDYEFNSPKMELRCALQLAQCDKAQIFPILRAGDAAMALPESLRQYFVRDFRADCEYARMMVGLLNPLGLIPAVTRVHQVSTDYRAALDQYVLRTLTKRLPERNCDFTGHEERLAEVAAMLRLGPTAIVQDKSAPGLGGVGKSELAAELAWRHCQKPYILVRWINVPNIVLEMQALADDLWLDTQSLSLEQILGAVFVKLCSCPSLLIFDDADSLEAVAAFLPPPALNQHNICHVLVTSSDVDGSTTWPRTVTMSGYTAAEAEDYVLKVLPAVEIDKVDKLAALVHLLPLALSQAVAFIWHAGLVADEYIDSFSRCSTALEAGDSHDQPFQVVCTLTAGHLAATHPAAAQLLGWLAYLGQDRVPMALFGQPALLASEQAVSAAAIVLREYGLCRLPRESDDLRVHTLVQTCIQRSDRGQGAKELALNSPSALISARVLPLLQGLCEYYSQACPSTTPYLPPQVSFMRRLLPHFQALTRHSELPGDRHADASPALMQGTADAFRIFGTISFHLGFHEQAMVALQRATELQEGMYGVFPDRQALSYNMLGKVYIALAQPELAQPCLERALKHHVATHGHLELVDTLLDLALVFGCGSHFERQKAALEKVLNFQRKLFGQEHVELSKTLVKLAAVYGCLHDLGKQKALLELALKLQERHYVRGHIEIGLTLKHLGNAYGALGEYHEAVTLLQRALNILERQENHVESATVLKHLANAFGALGEYEKKKQLLQRALNIQVAHFGKSHINVAFTLTSLGCVYGDLGDGQRKRAMLENALQMQEEYYGPEHTEVARTLTNLGNAYAELGRHQQARDALLRALAIKEKLYGSGHVEVAKTLSSLGCVYELLDELGEAEQLLLRALDIKQRHFGSEHVELSRTLASLGQVYGRRGHQAKKLQLVEQALAIKTRHYGTDHVEVARTLASLGSVYGALGDHERKRKLLERALAIEERHFGGEHAGISRTLVSLGNAHGALGSHGVKRKLLQRALRIQEKDLGPMHAKLVRTLASLGWALAAQGLWSEAVHTMRRAVHIAASCSSKDNLHPLHQTAYRDLQQLLEGVADHEAEARSAMSPTLPSAVQTVLHSGSPSKTSATLPHGYNREMARKTMLQGMASSSPSLLHLPRNAAVIDRQALATPPRHKQPPASAQGQDHQYATPPRVLRARMLANRGSMPVLGSPALVPIADDHAGFVTPPRRTLAPAGCETPRSVPHDTMSPDYSQATPPPRPLPTQDRQRRFDEAMAQEQPQHSFEPPSPVTPSRASVMPLPASRIAARAMSPQQGTPMRSPATGGVSPHVRTPLRSTPSRDRIKANLFPAEQRITTL